MTITELLAGFANPDVVHSLSVSDKLTAGLVTTLLGMGITFSALVILQFIISWMDKGLNRKKKTKAPEPLPQQQEELQPQEARENPIDDNELVAVIASVLAANLKTSVENIVIRNIERIEDRSPAWNRAGIIEQMNSRL